jgi:hypothetical protein
VSARLFWSSLGVQAATLVVLFAVLALSLPREFFRDYGFLAGPVAWLICSVVTWRVLSLPVSVVALAATAGALAGVAPLLTLGHTAGLVAALLAFALCCAAVRGRPAALARGQ